MQLNNTDSGQHQFSPPSSYMHQDNIGNTQLYTRPNRELTEAPVSPGNIPPTVPPPPDTDETKAGQKPSSVKNIIPITTTEEQIGDTVLFTRPTTKAEKTGGNIPSTVLVSPAAGDIRKINIQSLEDNKASAHSSTAKPATLPISHDSMATRVISQNPGAPSAMPNTVPVNVPASNCEPTRLISRNSGAPAAMPNTVPVNVPASNCEPTRLISRNSGAPSAMPATVPVNVPTNNNGATELISRNPGAPAAMPDTMPVNRLGQTTSHETYPGNKTRTITQATGKVVPINVDYEAQPHTQYPHERPTPDTITVPVSGIENIPISQEPRTATTLKPTARQRKGGCLLACLMLLLLLITGAELWYYGPALVAPGISKGYTNGVRLLTAIPGLNPNTPGENGQPPLTMAIQAGNMEAVRVLLAAPGIDINRCDIQGHPPIYYAAAQGNTECVRFLLAMPGITVPANAVEIAEQNKHKEAAALLRASKDYAVNALSAQGVTPDTYSIALLAASAAGDAERLQTLLTAGATAETLDANGRSALFLAVDKNHVDCVRLLLTAPGTDVNTPNVNNITPLWVSAISGHAECMRLLLTVPEINVNHADEDGETALYWAAQQGHKECVRMLLAAPGINVNCTTSSGATPLQRATANGHRECANMLRAAGAQ